MIHYRYYLSLDATLIITGDSMSLTSLDHFIQSVVCHILKLGFIPGQHLPTLL